MSSTIVRPRLTDPVQARKRQNRQAQVVYRERKRAAESAQKDRIHHLENVVEQMSSVFMDFADEMMGDEELKRNRTLVDSLRKTIGAMVRLGGQVVDPRDSDPSTSTPEQPVEAKMIEEAEQTTLVQPHSQQEESPFMAGVSTEANVFPQATMLSFPNTSAFPPFEPLSDINFPSTPSFDLSQKRSPSPKMPQSFFGNGWLPYHGDFVDMTPPFEGVYVPPDSFSLRLVERTMETSYDVLFRDDSLVDEHTMSIFKYTLQSKTRQGILAYVRWMLGPGHHRVYKAADIPASRVAELLGRGQSHLVEWDGEGILRVEDGPDVPVQGPAAPAVLSAVEVQRKLEELGACQLDGDLLELTLTGSESLPNRLASDADAYRSQQMAEAMTIRLSVPLLIYNLSMTAVCLDVGLGFRSESLYEAVEASIIPIPTDGVI